MAYTVPFFVARKNAAERINHHDIYQPVHSVLSIIQGIRELFTVTMPYVSRQANACWPGQRTPSVTRKLAQYGVHITILSETWASQRTTVQVIFSSIESTQIMPRPI